MLAQEILSEVDRQAHDRIGDVIIAFVNKYYADTAHCPRVKALAAYVAGKLIIHRGRKRLRYTAYGCEPGLTEWLRITSLMKTATEEMSLLRQIWAHSKCECGMCKS